VSFTAVGNPAAYSASLRARLRMVMLRARLRMVTLGAWLRAGQTHACSVRGSSKLRHASSKRSHVPSDGNAEPRTERSGVSGSERV